jgi:magnesium-transporting ATPase (P-type)
MFSNAVLGGALGAAFVTILVLQLNPHLPLTPAVVLPLYGRLEMFYGIQLAVAFYMALVIWQLFGPTLRSPGWISLRLQSWFGTLIVSSAALLMWVNVTGFHVVLEDDTIRRIAAAAGATMVCAVLLAVIRFAH